MDTLFRQCSRKWRKGSKAASFFFATLPSTIQQDGGRRSILVVKVYQQISAAAANIFSSCIHKDGIWEDGLGKRPSNCPLLFALMDNLHHLVLADNSIWPLLRLLCLDHYCLNWYIKESRWGYQSVSGQCPLLLNLKWIEVSLQCDNTRRIIFVCISKY